MKETTLSKITASVRVAKGWQKGFLRLAQIRSGPNMNCKQLTSGSRVRA